MEFGVQGWSSEFRARFRNKDQGLGFVSAWDEGLLPATSQDKGSGSGPVIVTRERASRAKSQTLILESEPRSAQKRGSKREEISECTDQSTKERTDKRKNQ